MKNYIIILFICFILFSCKKEKNKEFYKNGNLKAIHYGSKEKIDSSIYYFEKNDNSIHYKKYYLNDTIYKKIYHFNNVIQSKGYVDSLDNHIGKWYFYNSTGKLVLINEYLNISGEEYLNQSWKIKEKDTLFEQSKFVEFLFNKDTIRLNEPLRAAGYLRTGLFGSNSDFYILLSKGYESKYEKNFINEKLIKIDTFLSLKFDTINQVYFNKKFNPKKIVSFGKWFKTTGDKVVRGIGVEHYREKLPESDSIINKVNKTYFEKKVYVLDSVMSND